MAENIRAVEEWESLKVGATSHHAVTMECVVPYWNHPWAPKYISESHDYVELSRDKGDRATIFC